MHAVAGGRCRGKLNLLIGWLSLLSLTVAARAQDPPSPPPSVDAQEFRDAYSNWQSDRKLVQILEAQAYAKTPELKQLEQEYRQLKDQWHQQEKNFHSEAVKYLDEHPSALDTYKHLEEYSGGLFLLSALKDPRKERLLKETMMATSEMRSRLAEQLHLSSGAADDADALWAALKKHALDSEPQLRHSIDHLLEQTQLPPAVVKQAMLYGKGKVASEVLYDPAIARETPADLKSARERIKGDAGVLSQLWPGWADALQQPQPASSTRPDQ